MIFFGAILTKCTGFLNKVNYYSCYVRRTMLASPSLWMQKHANLRTQNFKHCHILWHKRRFAKFT